MNDDTALAQRCGLCGAKAGEPCRNTLQPGQPLPGRTVHWFRLDVRTRAVNESRSSQVKREARR
jgi:hypothetical protein